MKKESHFKWQCDSCEMISTTELERLPYNWMNARLYLGNSSIATYFDLCGACIGNNPETFRQHIKKAFNIIRCKK